MDISDFDFLSNCDESQYSPLFDKSSTTEPLLEPLSDSDEDDEIDQLSVHSENADEDDDEFSETEKELNCVPAKTKIESLDISKQNFQIDLNSIDLSREISMRNYAKSIVNPLKFNDNSIASDKSLVAKITSLWISIEKTLFYKYYWYARIEYLQGVRTLGRLINSHPEWIRDGKYSTVTDWISGKWVSEIYLPNLLHFEIEKELEPLSEFTCRRCKKTGRVSVNEKQMKSKDEGGTVFYECDNCGNHWKE
jgi:DNA-directed RNA polymerase subunit M/transcription elongation factor TFIIS